MLSSEIKNTADWKRIDPLSHGKAKRSGEYRYIVSQLNLDIPDKEGKKRDIRIFFELNGRLPSRSQEKVENSLHSALANYCREGKSFDPNFASWARSIGYGDSVSRRKSLIREFYENTGRLPSKNSNIKSERHLGQSIASYCKKNQPRYDIEFETWLRSVGYGLKTSEITKIAIKSFFEENKRFPSSGATLSSIEKKLYKALGGYCSPSSKRFDSNFRDWARSVGYARDSVSLSKNDIEQFYVINLRLPSSDSNDRSEKQLGERLQSYCSKCSSTFDAAFAKWASFGGYGDKRKGADRKRKEIKDFFAQFSRMPSQHSKNDYERRLGEGLVSYCASKSPINAEFCVWARSMGYGQQKGRPKRV